MLPLPLPYILPPEYRQECCFHFPVRNHRNRRLTPAFFGSDGKYFQDPTKDVSYNRITQFRISACYQFFLSSQKQRIYPADVPDHTSHMLYSYPVHTRVQTKADYLK